MAFTPATAAVVSPTLDFAVYRNATSRLKGGGAGGIDAATRSPNPHDIYGRTRPNGYRESDWCSSADPEKKALLGACTNVVHLTRYVGTELHGLQLTQLTDKQKDELGLLIAERSVVFFRDQEVSSRSPLLLEEQYRETGGHPQVAQMPGVPGVTVIGPNFQIQDGRTKFWQPGGPSPWHSDFVHLDPQHRGVVCPNDTTPDTPDFDPSIIRANCLTNDKLQFTWTPGTSALWDNRVLTWMTQH